MPWCSGEQRRELWCADRQLGEERMAMAGEVAGRQEYSPRIRTDPKTLVERAPVISDTTGSWPPGSGPLSGCPANQGRAPGTQG